MAKESAATVALRGELRELVDTLGLRLAVALLRDYVEGGSTEELEDSGEDTGEDCDVDSAGETTESTLPSGGTSH